MKSITLISLFFLFYIGVSDQVHAQSSFKVKSSSGANLRQGPDKGKSVVASIPGNARVKVVDRSNPDWYKVEYNGQTGYVSSSLIENAEDDNRQANSENKPQTAQKNDDNNRNESNSRNNSSTNSSQNNKKSNKSNKSKGSNSGSSSAYQWGVGLRLGDPAGISVKKYNGGSAWEFNLGRSARWGYNYHKNDFYKDEFYRYDKYSNQDYYHYDGHRVGFTTALQGRYLIQKPFNDLQGLSYYFGGGAQMRFTPVHYEYHYKDSWGRDVYVTDRVTDIDLGLDGVLGLEYTFDDLPLSIFLDANLFIEIIDAPMFISGQSGLGIRYNFK